MPSTAHAVLGEMLRKPAWAKYSITPMTPDLGWVHHAAEMLKGWVVMRVGSGAIKYRDTYETLLLGTALQYKRRMYHW
jgi:hypothetical protein